MQNHAIYVPFVLQRVVEQPLALICCFACRHQKGIHYLAGADFVRFLTQSWQPEGERNQGLKRLGCSPSINIQEPTRSGREACRVKVCPSGKECNPMNPPDTALVVNIVVVNCYVL